MKKHLLILYGIFLIGCCSVLEASAPATDEVVAPSRTNPSALVPDLTIEMTYADFFTHLSMLPNLKLLGDLSVTEVVSLKKDGHFTRDKCTWNVVYPSDVDRIRQLAVAGCRGFSLEKWLYDESHQTLVRSDDHCTILHPVVFVIDSNNCMRCRVILIKSRWDSTFYCPDVRDIYLQTELNATEIANPLVQLLRCKTIFAEAAVSEEARLEQWRKNNLMARILKTSCETITVE
jgi:hypothetical protein